MIYVYSRVIIFRLTWIIVLLFFVSGCSSVTVSPPVKTAVAADETEKQLLQQGEILYRQGKFESALPKVQETLKLNPDNVEAIYAMALCYMALEKYQKSLEYSKLAATYKSQYLEDIYLLMGRSYQQLNDPWNALRTYRYAASVYPKNAKLQYRLGETYVYLDKPELASDAFKAAILADPDDASSHFQLGMIYYAFGYNTPALLSLSTSLLLAPGQLARLQIQKNIIDLLDRESESGKTDEGDFQSVDATLVRQRSALLNSAKKQTAFEMIKAQYLSLIAQLNTKKISNQKTFVIDNYVPLYNKVHLQQLDETFVYYIFQGSKDKNISGWLENHPEKTKQLEQLFQKKTGVENASLLLNDLVS
jgi:tetratricopeptide (TPR) repeat protein